MPLILSNYKENISVVVGCDDYKHLSTILGAFNPKEIFSFLTASRVRDLVNMIKSTNPWLVILSYRQHQTVINQLTSQLDNLNCIIFCFTHSDERRLSWPSYLKLISYPFELAVKEDSIQTRISSIYSITQGSYQKKSTEVHKGDSIARSKNLSRYVLELDQKKEILARITERIKFIYPKAGDEIRQQLLSLINTIKSQNHQSSYWDDFKLYFENVNPDFLNFLTTKHPNLTSKDLKYCCYLKMNMSNNDIMQLLGINQESVRTHKYRLKKKLVLSKDQNLEHYLKSYDREMRKSAG